MNFMKLYTRCLNKYPILTQAVQTSLLMGTGDIISQTVVEKKSIMDIKWKRTGQFMSVGFFVGGPGLRAWYGKLNNYFGSEGKTAALKKVVCDQFLFAPTFIVVILVTIAAMQGQSIEENLNSLKRDYFDVLVNNFKLWPLVQLVNFYFVPLNYQVLVVQIVAVFWNTYISWKTNLHQKP